MIDKNKQVGITLIELMITVAILGIVAAISAPFLTEYVSTGREAVMRDNINTIRLFQEDYKLQNRAYVEGTYNPSAPSASGGLKDLLGWEPRTEQDKITYVVACDADTADSSDPECQRSSGYTVTATHSDYSSDPVCMSFSATGREDGDC